VTLLTRRPDQKPSCDPLTFVFFVFLLKRRHFDFFFKELTRVTWSKPRTRALDRAGHRAGSENYAYDNSFIYLFVLF
jgi:hypothetical protein